MNFLIDAQLPRRLTHWLHEAGHDGVHTLDLPLGNRTPDSVVNEISLRERRVVVTKDEDFVDSFLIYRRPYKLLLVSTGNIRNAELELLFHQNIEHIVESFDKYDFVEVDRTALIFHL